MIAVDLGVITTSKTGASPSDTVWYYTQNTVHSFVIELIPMLYKTSSQTIPHSEGPKAFLLWLSPLLFIVKVFPTPLSLSLSLSLSDAD